MAIRKDYLCNKFMENAILNLQKAREIVETDNRPQRFNLRFKALYYNVEAIENSICNKLYDDIELFCDD